MKIINEFEVSRSVDTVWEFFQDVTSVAQCLPGATITEDKGGGVYAGKRHGQTRADEREVRRRGDHQGGR